MSIDILDRYTSAVLATIPGSSLSGVTFSGLNLTNADLSNVDLSTSIFTGCNASGSTFEDSNLTGTNFFRSNVQGADFRGVTRDTTSNFHACFFEDVLVDSPDDDVSTWFLPFFYGGQSNCVSIDSGPTSGLPDATIPYFFNTPPSGDSGGLWGALDINLSTGDHGAEIIFAQTLKALGLDIGPAKIARGATTMSDWASTSSGEYTTVLMPSLLQAVSELQNIRPGQFSRWFGAWYLGEDDSRSEGAGGSLYGDNFLSMQIGISGLVGNNVWKRFNTVLMPTWLANQIANSIDNVRYWQTLLSFGTMNVDSLAHQVDNVHLTAAGQDALGVLWATAAQVILDAEEP
jgi:hypothetical protein